MIDCTDEQLIAEVRRRGFVIRDAQIGRKWVGLTDQERANCWSSSAVESAINIEQALKDKNT